MSLTPTPLYCSEGGCQLYCARPFAGGRHGVADGNGLFLDRGRQ